MHFSVFIRNTEISFSWKHLKFTCLELLVMQERKTNSLSKLFKRSTLILQCVEMSFEGRKYRVHVLHVWYNALLCCDVHVNFDTQRILVSWQLVLFWHFLKWEFLNRKDFNVLLFHRMTLFCLKKVTRFLHKSKFLYISKYLSKMNFKRCKNFCAWS